MGTGMLSTKARVCDDEKLAETIVAIVTQRCGRAVPSAVLTPWKQRLDLAELPTAFEMGSTATTVLWIPVLGSVRRMKADEQFSRGSGLKLAGSGQVSAVATAWRKSMSEYLTMMLETIEVL
mmetsp:Transcript_5711/g.10948  ORF Transcript_5711/g.10948 Transcript_5711/m.10948 type:complete len:122 (+) Transcript_5711:1374-1739(+)